ncbi:hypothetical protein [Apilactobacillus kunkeei]|uniref:hypothetical protein n=1 Tax=Apilactobacillus kunkeei TaxID=148814 RepID=UPI00200AB886|nr:hypothetical protein [Apilactobacillus kunkeei]MCK8626211.1 hypothetical protein [Apilactobacillus kunkeei]
MEFIGTILSYVFIGSIIAFFVVRSKNKKGKVKNYKKDKLIILITMISSFILTGVCYSLSPQAKQDSIQEAREEKQKAKDDKSSSISSSISKKEEKNEKESINKNLENNLNDYKKELSKFPSKTNNAITKAYVDNDLKATIIVLNDNITTSDQDTLKTFVRTTYTSTQKVYDNFKPFDDNKLTQYIYIQDEEGNDLAKSNAFGQFKYLG